ncbi:MAG: ComEA family DNA-binding protein [Thermodesulfobacteriota bacterium]
MTKEQQGVALFLGLIMLVYFIWDSSSFFPPAALEKIKGDRITQIPLVEIYRSPMGAKATDVLGKNPVTKQSQSFDLEKEDQKVWEGNHLYISGEGNNLRTVSGESVRLSNSPALLLPININKATFEELSTLPGVGPKTAQAILAFRDAHGPFKSAEDLLQVRGLGPKKLAAIRERITVQ